MKAATTTGEAINQMADAIRLGRGDYLDPTKKVIVQGWLDVMVEAAARLDPDNQPLTLGQLTGMKPKL